MKPDTLAVAHEMTKILMSRGLTLDQASDVLVDMMSIYIVAFTESHDRHSIPQVAQNVATKVEARVNMMLDERYGPK